MHLYDCSLKHIPEKSVEAEGGILDFMLKIFIYHQTTFQKILSKCVSTHIFKHSQVLMLSLNTPCVCESVSVCLWVCVCVFVGLCMLLGIVLRASIC